MLRNIFIIFSNLLTVPKVQTPKEYWQERHIKQNKR